jgi:hypothetical protein
MFTMSPLAAKGREGEFTRSSRIINAVVASRPTPELIPRPPELR